MPGLTDWRGAVGIVTGASSGIGAQLGRDLAARGVRVALLACGESHIELLEPLSDDSIIAKFLKRRGPGIHHLCLASSDIHADDARLRAGGYQVLRPEPTRGAGGCWVQFVHPRSAGGVLIELSEKGDEEHGS